MSTHQSIDFEGRTEIRCIQQLGMLRLWERLRGSAEMPQEARVQGEDIERLRDKLMMCDVEWRGSEPYFLIRFHGPDFDRSHGRNCSGKFLNDIMAPAIRERGLKTYRHVVDRRIPAFNATPIRDHEGRTVNYERLLLPFTRSGQGVDHIYSVITLFAEENQSPFETMRNAVPQPR